MTLKSIALVPALAVGLGVCSTGSAQTQPSVTIEVDANGARTPLEPIWSFYGYDEANYTTTPEGEELLRTLVAAHTGKPIHVRTHFLFNTGDGTPAIKWGSTNLYTEDAQGNPLYSYALIDSIMDATARAGALPLIELGFMPQALSTKPEPYGNSDVYELDSGCFYPPRDYEKWGSLVTAWATHVKERYPDAEASWLWELWNEPDIGYWKGTFDEYARLYDYTEAALHSVLPNAPLGGPAVASVANPFLAQFLEHCATGTNAVSGQTGTRLDLVSFHSKGGVRFVNGAVRMNLGNQLNLHRSGFATVAASKFARTPVVISEADPDGCAACPASDSPAVAYRTSPAYGAYEVAMMKRTLDLAAEQRIDLRGVLTWAFTFPRAPYFVGYRELSTNGIHLPVLNAFKLLGRLQGERLPLTSSGALPLSRILETGVRDRPDIDALAAIDGDRIHILVWNYHDDLVDAQHAPVTLTVAVPAGFGRAAVLTHTRADDTHGNAVKVWESQGRPTSPSAQQIAALRQAMEPVVLERARAVEVTNGAVSLSLTLPRFGISLLTLAPSNAAERPGSHPGGAGCACRAVAATPGNSTQLLVLALAGVLAWARRRHQVAARGRLKNALLERPDSNRRF